MINRQGRTFLSIATDSPSKSDDLLGIGFLFESENTDWSLPHRIAQHWPERRLRNCIATDTFTRRL